MPTKLINATTIATSRKACCSVTAAVTTRMQTIKTPIRSMATTRSGSVGPFSSLMNVKHAAAASMVDATTDGVVSAPMVDTQPRTPRTRRSNPFLISSPRRVRRVMYITCT